MIHNKLQHILKALIPNRAHSLSSSSSSLKTFQDKAQPSSSTSSSVDTLPGGSHSQPVTPNQERNSTTPTSVVPVLKNIVPDHIIDLFVTPIINEKKNLRAITKDHLIISDEYGNALIAKQEKARRKNEALE